MGRFPAARERRTHGRESSRTTEQAPFPTSLHTANRPFGLGSLFQCSVDRATQANKPSVPRSVEFNTQRPPRPNQLYSDKVETYTLARWLEWKSANGMLAESVTDQRFLSANFRGDPPQVDYENYVIESIVKRAHVGDLAERVRAHVFSHGWLREARARKEFGDAVVDKNTFISTSSYRPGAGADAPYVKSCFGLPNAFEPNSDVWTLCPFFDTCPEAAEEAVSLIIDVYGTDNPRRQTSATMARLRQRKHREKKRAGRDLRPRGRPRKSQPPSAK